MSDLPVFTRWLQALGVPLSPAQLQLWRVFGDGELPQDDEIGRQLFGGVTEISGLARRCVVQVKGARTGGSMLSAYRLTYLAEIVPLVTLAPGERPSGIVVAPDMRLGRQTLAYIPEFAELAGIPVRAKTSDSVTVVRSDGREVVLEALPASAGGRAVRGRSLVGAVMSEASFFRDSDYVVNDEEIYRALMPRILPGGQLIIESTPWAESGLLYNLDKENFGGE